MPYVRSNGISLYYERCGRGRPVVLIGGLGSDGHLWYKQAPRLAEHFQVITPDNRGAGRSDTPDEPYTLAMMAADLLGLVDALELPAVSLVGVSMGGFIAQEFALAYPDRVDRLILCSTSFGGLRSAPIPDETIRILQSRTGDPERDLRAFLTVQFATDYTETHMKEVDEYVAWRVAHPQPVYAYQRQFAAALVHITEDRLAGLRCPVLILHGAQDRVVPSDNARLLAARIPHAEVYLFRDTGHLLLWERAEEVNDRIIEFLSRQGGGRNVSEGALSSTNKEGTR